jgi:hypothetical protein
VCVYVCVCLCVCLCACLSIYLIFLKDIKVVLNIVFLEYSDTLIFTPSIGLLKSAADVISASYMIHPIFSLRFVAFAKILNLDRFEMKIKISCLLGPENHVRS